MQIRFVGCTAAAVMAAAGIGREGKSNLFVGIDFR